jgi:hypothetical protein
VVVEFSPSDLGLTSQQRDKLIKLSGPRYNPSSDLIKLSAEQFDTQTQNKRFLGDTITALVAEAKDANDTFEDVPFDFRHHKEKVFHEFPREWILTPERKQYLEAKRAEKARLEDERSWWSSRGCRCWSRRCPCWWRRGRGSKISEAFLQPRLLGTGGWAVMQTSVQCGKERCLLYHRKKALSGCITA